MPDRSLLLDSLKGRNSRTGIVTADRYFREVEQCFEGGFCPVQNIGAASEDAWRKSLKESENKLTYTNDEMRIVKRSIKSGKTVDDGGIMQFDCIVTTPLRDRDGDVLETKGAKLDKNAPLLWQHVHFQPIGKLVKLLKQTESELRAQFILADTALGRDAATLVKLGALRISHGFEPIEWDVLEDEKGYHFKEFSIHEVSLVSIPSNVDAVITSIGGKSFGSELFRGWQKSLSKTPSLFKGCTCKTHKADDDSGEIEIPDPPPEDNEARRSIPTGKVVRRSVAEPILTKDFDVERQHVEAAKLEYDWISRFCSCEVKQLVNFGTYSARIRMGSFLTGFKYATKESIEVDARRLTAAGMETPLEYETIQLNAKDSGHFLVDGISFRKLMDGTCFAVKFVREWSGESVDVFAARKDEQKVANFLSEAWTWAHANNFLKGQAFSLSGELLPKTGEQWGDLFLDPVNEKEVKRAVDLLNAKGKDCPNRGIVMMGPPGTGKTLSLRLMRNHADATFIWVGGRDAYNFGPVGSITEAFDLAKELAPAIVAFEDIDASFTYDRPIDVMKTEMDGVGRSSGITTVLTTNFPKNLPEALLDRPGRFHDVLKFDLPDKDLRGQMLAKWLPNLDAVARTKTVDATDGYSGAHVYELCQYAKTLAETEEVGIGDAVTKALQKIADQRTLIDEALLGDRKLAGRRRETPVSTVKSREIRKSVGGEAESVILPTDPPAKTLDQIRNEFIAACKGATLGEHRNAHRDSTASLEAREDQEKKRVEDEAWAPFRALFKV